MHDNQSRRPWPLRGVGYSVLAASLMIASVSLAWGQSGSRYGTGGERRRGAQSGSRYSGSAQPRSQARSSSQRSFEQRFWDYLQTVHYRNWAPFPGGEADFYPGQSPHGAFLKLYGNRTAVGAAGEMPPGSIIVKENYGGDSRDLMAVTVMYKVDGYDPENNDWYWVKYEPDGKVSTMQGMPLAGRVSGCIDCHSAAGGGDFVFEND